jgi:hypothetical protein
MRVRSGMTTHAKAETTITEVMKIAMAGGHVFVMG